MEKRKPVDTYEVNLYCDVCGGLMELQEHAMVLYTYPPQYEYHCTQCGSTVITNRQYPYMEYKERT